MPAIQARHSRLLAADTPQPLTPYPALCAQDQRYIVADRNTTMQGKGLGAATGSQGLAAAGGLLPHGYTRGWGWTYGSQPSSLSNARGPHCFGCPPTRLISPPAHIYRPTYIPLPLPPIQPLAPAADGRHERLLLWGDAALSETGPKAIDDMIESVRAFQQGRGRSGCEAASGSCPSTVSVQTVREQQTFATFAGRACRGWSAPRPGAGARACRLRRYESL